MRIAIDARAYGWTGIGRYTRNVLKEYAALQSPHQFVVMVPEGKQAELAKLLDLPLENQLTPPGCKIGEFEVVGVEGSYYSWREQTVFLKQLYKVKADLFHFTHFNVPLLFRRPYVVTIHDTTRFIFPGEKRQRLIEQIGYEIVFAQAVVKAKAVICVSEATKHDLEALPVHTSASIGVIYEGVDDVFGKHVDVLSAQKANLLLGGVKNYLLYVGVWMNHKNLRRLLAAFEIVKKRFPQIKLVMTGQPVPAYSPVLKEVERLDLRDSVVFPGFVPHELLPALYAGASCFLFPSLYEGFGLPPLEAAACGVPVVASNVSSLPEIMGLAAEYVNPEDEADIARGVMRVLEDGRVRQRLIEEGKKRILQFSWRVCAQETLALYEKLEIGN
ncbi:MAG: glycosyltransferase family 4 protein [Candidatus Andersenbacteria bacterium]|nr:glycosyltransferase family 4 protein [Candidatus Andersenbacteria bacterium]